jgi:hypothetical protein
MNLKKSWLSLSETKNEDETRIFQSRFFHEKFPISLGRFADARKNYLHFKPCQPKLCIRHSFGQLSAAKISCHYYCYNLAEFLKLQIFRENWTFRKIPFVTGPCN